MTVRPSAIALLVVLAASCGGGDASALGAGDYFTQLARISENAHIQQRGLARDLRVRLERAEPGTELDVVEVYVGQSARLSQDVVDALTDLQPADGLQDVHAAYLGAWQSELDLLVKVRDAGFRHLGGYLEALEAQPFEEARDQIQARCEDLQTAAAAAGRELDLACEGRR
jgi:hypothetical protein